MEEHLLLKIVKAHSAILSLQKQKEEMLPNEYTAEMLSICLPVAKQIMYTLEKSEFIADAQAAMEINPDFRIDFIPTSGKPERSGAGFEWGHYGFPAKSIVTKYLQFKQYIYNAEFGKEERSLNAVLALDSIINWIHSTYQIAQQIVFAHPIYGDFYKDYRIYTHTLYLLEVKNNPYEAFDYVGEMLDGAAKRT